ncbi:PDZ domain-containing protein 11-like [Watersipora subatra]|uniref:PDZ domain-containing protein 11-like n=1 Tax=Watersipora subatra TaxID=2589382 RepID=UPI00355BE0CC
MQYDSYRQQPPRYPTDQTYSYDAEYRGRQEYQPPPQEQLPVVQLPAYELPPEFVPRSERRFHPEYSTDLQNFRNRTIHLQRNKPADQLGFNVRGGAEHKCGIFISKVTPRTDAHKAGLQEGDQILFVNGESFLHIDQHEAVRILKKWVNVELIVKYFPYAYDKSFDKCKSNPASS